MFTTVRIGFTKICGVPLWVLTETGTERACTMIDTYECFPLAGQFGAQVYIGWFERFVQFDGKLQLIVEAMTRII